MGTNGGEADGEGMTGRNGAFYCIWLLVAITNRQNQYGQQIESFSPTVYKTKKYYFSVLFSYYGKITLKML